MALGSVNAEAIGVSHPGLEVGGAGGVVSSIPLSVESSSVDKLVGSLPEENKYTL